MLGAGGVFVGYLGTSSTITALKNLAPVQYCEANHPARGTQQQVLLHIRIKVPPSEERREHACSGVDSLAQNSSKLHRLLNAKLPSQDDCSWGAIARTQKDSKRSGERACGVCTSHRSDRSSVFTTIMSPATSLMVGFTGTPSTAAPCSSASAMHALQHGWTVTPYCWRRPLENRWNNSELFYVLGRDCPCTPCKSQTPRRGPVTACKAFYCPLPWHADLYRLCALQLALVTMSGTMGCKPVLSVIS